MTFIWTTLSKNLGPATGCNIDFLPCRDRLVVSMSASNVVGRGSAPQPGHTKDHHKHDTNCLPSWQEYIRVGV